MFRKFKDDTGAALMMAIFAVTMLMIIATEVMYDTNVEYAVSAQTVNQVRAHYAAKSGLEISLLRLFIYKKANAALGDMAKQLPILDMIWQMPFSWPPMIPDETNAVDKSTIKASVKTSLMQGQYMATIESESGKIDLSLLASDNEDLAKATEAQLTQIFQNKVRDDEAFAKKYSATDFTKLVGNIKDWVDADDKSESGGDERSMYSDLQQGDRIPPNQPFKTFEELHMVAGMTDEFYNLLLPKITIYGSKAVNVKYASKEVLKATFGLTEDQATKLMDERDKKDTQIMKDAQSFTDFLVSLGVRKETLVNTDNTPKIPILVEPEFNFRVHSIGTSGKVQREITAIVYDYDKVLAQLKANQPKGSPTPIPPGAPPVTPGAPTPTPSPTPASGGTVPNERPNIVYWNET